ncbi:SRR1-like protein [Scaptodrosophila lebanonensis]|uniref:SRR1-like protein n=1 Tax=Drosophila lebanonensis TaxID=7225 RepID=A0A6J2TAB8_DROLE|nr:SRR1-like protein [Scaptodrosophila lebanonensis]
MSESEFQYVTRKKWMARKCLRRRDRHKSESDYLNDCPDVNVDKFQERLEKLCGVMSQSDYFIMSMETLQQQLDKLKAPLNRIVCLGLGPFTRTHQALHQTAFILSTQRLHKIKESIYFDPVFRESEMELLRRFNGIIMPEDCAGQHGANVPTLYYLPHCPHALMHNLLWYNWNFSNLPNVLLISNSFEMLNIKKPLTRSRSKSNGNDDDDDHIARIAAYCTEIPLDDDYEQNNVFNDLSLHVFLSENLPKADDAEFWRRDAAPLKVCEEELITIDAELRALSIRP